MAQKWREELNEPLPGLETAAPAAPSRGLIDQHKAEFAALMKG